MSDVIYRTASLADAPVVADLFARTFTETFGHLYRPENLAAFLASVTAEAYAKELASSEFDIRIAEADGQAVGFTKLGLPSLPVQMPPGTLELWQIYVLRDWLGAGIGRTLYAAVEQRARERGASYLQLSVYIDNHRARRFYEKQNFEVVGRYDFRVGNHIDEDLVMRKAL